MPAVPTASAIHVTPIPVAVPTQGTAPASGTIATIHAAPVSESAATRSGGFGAALSRILPDAPHPASDRSLSAAAQMANQGPGVAVSSHTTGFRRIANGRSAAHQPAGARPGSDTTTGLTAHLSGAPPLPIDAALATSAAAAGKGSGPTTAAPDRRGNGKATDPSHTAQPLAAAPAATTPLVVMVPLPIGTPMPVPEKLPVSPVSGGSRPATAIHRQSAMFATDSSTPAPKTAPAVTGAESGINNPTSARATVGSGAAPGGGSVGPRASLQATLLSSAGKAGSALTRTPTLATRSPGLKPPPASAPNPTLPLGGTASVAAMSNAAAPVALATPVLSSGPTAAAQVAAVLVGSGPMPAAAGDGASGTRLTITMAPPAIGAVGIQIDTTALGHAVVAITATHPATLASLQNDHAALAAMLTQAGVPVDHRAITFHLEPTRDGTSDSGGTVLFGQAGSGNGAFGQGGFSRQSSQPGQGIAAGAPSGLGGGEPSAGRSDAPIRSPLHMRRFGVNMMA